jgi:hypothetical protein
VATAAAVAVRDCDTTVSLAEVLFLIADASSTTKEAGLLFRKRYSLEQTDWYAVANILRAAPAIDEEPRDDPEMAAPEMSESVPRPSLRAVQEGERAAPSADAAQPMGLHGALTDLLLGDPDAPF